MRRPVGERVRSALRSSVGLSKSCILTFCVRVRSAYSTQKQSRSSSSHLQRASQPAETTKKDSGKGARRALRAEVSVRLMLNVRVYPALRCQGSQNRPRRACGDLIHALGKPPDRCAPAEALSSQQGISVGQRVPSANRSQERVGLFNVVAAVRAAQQGCQPQSSKGRA